MCISREENSFGNSITRRIDDDSTLRTRTRACSSFVSFEEFPAKIGRLTSWSVERFLISSFHFLRK